MKDRILEFLIWNSFSLIGFAGSVWLEWWGIINGDFFATISGGLLAISNLGVMTK